MDPEPDPELDPDQEPVPDQLVRVTDPGMRIRTKMSRIPNTVHDTRPTRRQAEKNRYLKEQSSIGKSGGFIARTLYFLLYDTIHLIHLVPYSVA